MFELIVLIAAESQKDRGKRFGRSVQRHSVSYAMIWSLNRFQAKSSLENLVLRCVIAIELMVSYLANIR
jgi:hypothetical protein